MHPGSCILYVKYTIFNADLSLWAELLIQIMIILSPFNFCYANYPISDTQ